MPERPELDDREARVLGVLVEKELTTPDQYPLTLNALTLGCNQKSNRDPVMELTEGEVESTLHRLRMMQLVGFVHPAGGRVERYSHNAYERLDLAGDELSVLAELFLRGPQTRGELRARANRMRPIPDQEELARLLQMLTARALVRELPPAPGSRAGRVGHALGAAPEPGASPAASIPASTPGSVPGPPAAAAPPSTGLGAGTGLSAGTGAVSAPAESEVKPKLTLAHLSGAVDRGSGAVEHGSGAVERGSGAVERESGAVEREPGAVGEGLPLAERVALLEAEIRRLRTHLEDLAMKLGEPLED